MVKTTTIAIPTSDVGEDMPIVLRHLKGEVEHLRGEKLTQHNLQWEVRDDVLYLTGTVRDLYYCKVPCIDTRFALMERAIFQG